MHRHLPVVINWDDFSCLYNCSVFCIYTAVAVCLYNCQESTFHSTVIQTGKRRLNWRRRGVPTYASIMIYIYYLLFCFELTTTMISWVRRFWRNVIRIVPNHDGIEHDEKDGGDHSHHQLSWYTVIKIISIILIYKKISPHLKLFL